MPPRARLGAGTLLSFPLLMGVLFADVLFAGARIIQRDELHFLVPLAERVGRAWAGSSFLWDGGSGAGGPLLARWLPSALYPPHLLFAVMEPAWASSLLLIAHLALAGVAAALLASRYTSSTFAAWSAGAAYALGGYVMTLAGSGPYLYAAALAPLSIWLIHRLVERPCLGRSVAVAGIWGAQLLVGDPQTFLFSALLGVPLALANAGALAPLRWRQLRWPLAWLSLAAVVALGIAAAQLLPTVEFTALSTRAGGLPFAEATRWSLHPLRVSELLLPGLFGTQATHNTFWGGAWVRGGSQPWALGLHIGTLSLAGLSLLSLRRHAPGRGWLVATGVMLLLALGAYTPIYQLVHRLPVLGAFRYPAKHWVFVSLCLALLGAVGLSRLVSPAEGDGPRLWRRLTIVLAALVLLTGGAWLLFRSDGLLGLVVARAPAVDARAALDASAAAALRAFGVGVALTVIVLLRSHLHPRLFMLLVVLIVVTDLFTAGLRLRLTGEARWLSRQPALCAALPAPRAGLAPLIYRPGLAYRGAPAKDDRSPAEAYRRWQYDTLQPNIGSGRCVRFAVGYQGAPLAQQVALLRALQTQPRRLLTILGVRWIIDRDDGNARFGQGPSRRFPGLGVALYPFAGAPYLQIVSALRAARDPAVALRGLADAGFDPRSEAIAEARAEQIPAHQAGLRRSARLLRYQDGRITVATDFEAPAYLVVRESFYPGWHARWSDGRTDKDLALHRANGAFMTLAVPAGKGTLTLELESRSWRLGRLISIASLLLLALLGLGSWWSRLGERSSPD